MHREEIEQIRRQFKERQWPKWLEAIEISGLRGWTGQRVEFSFPVTAVVGENGAGKTLVLRSAACAYEAPRGGQSFYPSDFFLDTRWESFSDVTIEYTVRQGNGPQVFRLKKPSERWSYPEKRPERHVHFLDVGRTLPLDATVGYAKIAKKKGAETGADVVPEEFRQKLGHILGRDYSLARFATTDVDDKKKVGLLTTKGREYSQFHQGAGEDATLDLFALLPQIPNYSLLVIDEVESSLHPRAQRRLIRFLLELARKKKLQIIVSTHSPYILEELPEEGRILLMPGAEGPRVIYGPTVEFALSSLDEKVHPDLYVYTEDREAGILLREILAADPQGRELIPRIEVVPAGPVNVIKTLGKLAKEHKLPQRALAVVDGDMEPGPDCLALPGRKDQAPERMIFEDLKKHHWGNLTARWGVGAGNLLQWLDDTMLEPDHHRWTELLGDRLIKAKISVWETMVEEWARLCLSPAERARIVEAVRGAMA